ncbi:MAG: ATP-dependent RecD-like DNA helicase [bacterium]
MSNITGKLKTIIFHNAENGYLVALFRVHKENDKESHTITIKGNMPIIINDVTLVLTGDMEFDQKYKKDQFVFTAYEKIMPTDKENIMEFLKSSLVNGCGKKTAEKLVEAYKEDTLEVIKDLQKILDLGISEKTALKINSSIINFSKSSEDILELQKMNFTIEEASKIYNEYNQGTMDVVKNHFYKLRSIINFRKLDSIYLANNDFDSDERVVACMLEIMTMLSDGDGHTFYTKDMISSGLRSIFSIYMDLDREDEFYDTLKDSEYIVMLEDKIFLSEYFEAEMVIAEKLKNIGNKKVVPLKNSDDKILKLQDKLNIEYHYKQKEAICSAMNKNVTIISGGPGTGKTTILNSIVKLYIEENKISNSQIPAKIALLAPTGRASKKMSMATGLSACTIHRFLKWNKSDDTFEYNENNKLCHEFIVIDECSMIDVKLFASLLSALQNNVKLILVGDSQQLPSVGAGLVFDSLIESDLFNYTSLTRIYRQSDNSYIPDLAQSIKDEELTESFLEKKDDYNFLKVDSDNILHIITQAIFSAKSKGINEQDLQILAPVYKGRNGIDSLNAALRNTFNPNNFEKKEVIYNNIIYRENDKILQLTNDVEKNIFNGDIGFIYKINNDKNKITLTIKFDDQFVTVEKPYLKNMTHAYVISIHKSQGSEYEHVIMPIAKEYYNMMYNKLLYTGVSRAKKTLTLVGDPYVFSQGVRNNKSKERKTDLKTKLISMILE